MKREILKIEGAPKAVGPYSHGIRLSEHKELYFFSGQLGINPELNKIEGDITAQTIQVLKNLSTLLSANGMTAKNVIKATVFILDMADFPLVNAEYAKFFDADYPARTCFAVAALPLGGLVEIEIIAAK